MAAQMEGAHSRGGASRKRTQQIATALVSVMGTILVAFIGALPRLRNKDFAIEDLKQEVALLKQQANVVGKVLPPGA